MDPVRSQPTRFFNRELSRLDWNTRVLSMAMDRELPLLERAKFIAIASAHLDEFFQVRVAVLQRQREMRLELRSPDGLTPQDQLARIRERVVAQSRQIHDLFNKDLVPALAASGLVLLTFSELDLADRAIASRLFDQEIFPVLTPLSVDPAHPFPYISNLSLSLAVVLRDPKSGEHRFARVKVPPRLPRFFVLPHGQHFVAIEDLIAAHLDRLFPGAEVVSRHPFRVTRDAELAVEQAKADDLLQAIESSMMRRRRLNDVVRLEVESAMSQQVRDLLMRELEVGEDEVYVVEGPLDLSGLWSLYPVDRPDLRVEPWAPVTPVGLGSGGGDGIFRVLRERDVLVHHPYESFDSSVVAFLEQAARDPDVLAIKNTVYRTAESRNPIVRALTRAAQAGKEVVALVELQARFDEEANIEWARELEEAGVHVVYGIVGLKTHAKVALVVRQDADGLRRYCHVGTGNYNPETASQYEDVGLLSSRPELAEDLSQLFNYMTGFALLRPFRRLLVSPGGLRQGLLERIALEAKRPNGRIVIKVNNLSDPEIIDALYDASCAGTQIDLLVRSICTLRPGVPELSENIRVRSILGRFLEHSRIYCFGTGEERLRYVGSSDLSTGNLDRRVEVVVPIEEPELHARIDRILENALAEDVVRWELGADGAWRRQPASDGTSSQGELQRLARDPS